MRDSLNNISKDYEKKIIYRNYKMKSYCVKQRK